MSDQVAICPEVGYDEARVETSDRGSLCANNVRGGMSDQENVYPIAMGETSDQVRVHTKDKSYSVIGEASEQGAWCAENVRGVRAQHDPEAEKIVQRLISKKLEPAQDLL